jgi:hypothetical protein
MNPLLHVEIRPHGMDSSWDGVDDRLNENFKAASSNPGHPFC